MTGKNEQKRGLTAKEKIALATNAGGMMAGPAALGMAYRAAKNNEGGMPRMGARRLAFGAETETPTSDWKRDNRNPGKEYRTVTRTRNIPKGKLRSRLGRAVDWLDNPKNKKAKVAAYTAGGVGLTLQGLNWAGDTIATQTFKNKGKEAPVAKSWIRDNGLVVAYESDAPRGSGVGENLLSKAIPRDEDELESHRQRSIGRNQAIAWGAGIGATGSGAAIANNAFRVPKTSPNGITVQPKSNMLRAAFMQAKKRPGHLLGGAALMAAGPGIIAAEKMTMKKRYERWR